MALTSITQELRCTVCTKYMVEEIYSCVNGHNICKRCTAVKPECSKCKTKFVASRNITLEKIAAAMVFPCENEGCTEQFIGKDLLIHEENCEYGSFTCSLIFSSCKWKGRYSEVQEHVNKQHKINLETWKGVGNQQIMVRLYQDRVFFIFFKHSADIAQYSGVLVGPKPLANNFVLSVAFENPNNLKYKLFGSCPCIPLRELNKVFDGDQIIFGTKMMKHFLTGPNYASVVVISA